MREHGLTFLVANPFALVKAYKRISQRKSELVFTVEEKFFFC